MWPPLLRTISYNLFARGYRGRGEKGGGASPLFAPLFPSWGAYKWGLYPRAREQGRKGEGERKKYPVAKSSGQHPTLLFPGEVKKQDWEKYSNVIFYFCKYYIGEKWGKQYLGQSSVIISSLPPKKFLDCPPRPFPKKIGNWKTTPALVALPRQILFWTGREKYCPLPPFWTFDLPRFCVNKCSVWSSNRFRKKSLTFL